MILPLALALILLNGDANALWLGLLRASFRDVGQLVDGIVQVLFLFTPVFWVTTDVDSEQLIFLVGWNLLTYFPQVLRSSLLGKWPGVDSIIGSLLITVVNVIVGYLAFCRTRSRWAYWA